MSFRFATAAQWRACLFEQVDQDLGTDSRLRTFAPLSLSAFEPSQGGHAPAITRAGDILWRDDAGALHRLSTCAEAPEVIAAPSAIAQAERIIASASGLWVATDASLQCYEEDTLARLLSVDLANIIDIAADARDGIYALVGNQSIHVDRAGRIVDTITFEDISNAIAFTFLRLSERFVVLTGEPGHYQRLHWFAKRGGKAILTIPVGMLSPCFQALVLGSDARSRVFAAGNDRVLRLDADGNLLGDIPLDTTPTGIAANRDTLLVTHSRGLLRFTTTQTVPEGAGEARFTIVTPMLRAPEREDRRRWLRIEALANVPEGATLEISYAAIKKAADRDRLIAIAADDSLSASRRVQKLRSEPDLWSTPIVFHGQTVSQSPSLPVSRRAGAAGRPGGRETGRLSDNSQPETFAAPLFDVRDPYLWVAITLRAAAGARLPELTELQILYPGETLMDNLPSIYRRAETQPGSFLRSLVGVLETTTQDLDARIASMGSRIHPSTAPDEWLDFIARWLGLPWDDGLDMERKKAILAAAPQIASFRGTRRGLEALLESLMPGTARRFRVTDATADFGFAIVGGDGCTGSALPAMLGGRTRWSAELDSRAVLGFMRLPCAGQLDDGAWQLAGKIRIEIAATAEERNAWEPWLLTLITDMVPLTARIDLRWVSAHALRSDRLDGTLKLEAAPTAHLGTDAVTGLARLPERGDRSSSMGAHIGTPLR